MNRIAFFMVLGLILLGCASVPKADVQAQLDEPFILKAGQTAYLQSENILLKFVEVSEDSRCPSDVVCVWAGRVTATVQVQKGSGPLQTLNLTSEGGIEVVEEFNGYEVSLMKLDPYPKSTAPIKASDYSAKLRVSK
ncbi:MAG: hypothetical protein MN733_07155 [Nitrososphaera sp.]|nr:hypothetical protein [Nitrososphaera sp.]